MNTTELWQIVLSEIEVQVSRPIFATFLKGTFLTSLENSVATVGCPNQMMQRMAEGRYYSLIKSILDKHTGANNSLVFIVKQNAGAKKIEDKEVGPLFNTIDQSSDIAKKLHLNPFYTFANFAVSSSNQVAYAAAQAVVKNPGTAYNPLYLYGGVGVGKTHLMHAVAHDLLEKNGRLKLIYTTGEEFTNEIVEAIRQKNTNFFKTRYRGVGLLMVDDIQFIAGKEKVQEEFFHTFNALQRDSSQIILTSDKSPAEITGLEERLRSRFDGGLTIDISPPDFELRAAILLIKAKSLSINLPMDVAQFAAANIGDARALEGFLRRLKTEAQATKTSPSLGLARSILKKSGQPPEEHKIKVSPEKIIEAVATRFSLKPLLLKGPKRDRPLAFPRQILMYVLRVDAQYPYMEVGRLLGGRDHTTIMHGVEKISTLLSTDEKLREDIQWIKNRLWG